MNIVVTGSRGFIGRHMVEALRRRPDVNVIEIHRGNVATDLPSALARADVVMHLAGVNRPPNPEEFQAGNTRLTAEICQLLDQQKRTPLLIMSSSIQVAADNPYGRSKREAEQAIEDWSKRSGAAAVIFRLKNVFGKWCRPEYNSVTATFCHNVAHDLPITISDPGRELELVYVNDVVETLMEAIDRPPASGTCEFREGPRSFKTTLGELARKIRSFRDSRVSLVLPSFEDEFTRRLYATYLSYLDGPDFAYALQERVDARGSLAEFMKSAQFGQIFVSRTKPGITRGNHYHHTKTEKFMVVEGEAVIRFRPIAGEEIIEHRISGRDFKVVDIPPGYTHSIENVGDGEMVVLFWASEIFDPARPDTIALPVLTEEHVESR